MRLVDHLTTTKNPEKKIEKGRKWLALLGNKKAQVYFTQSLYIYLVMISYELITDVLSIGGIKKTE